MVLNPKPLKPKPQTLKPQTVKPPKPIIFHWEPGVVVIGSIVVPFWGFVFPGAPNSPK